MTKSDPRFFAGFTFWNFWWKASAGYIALLAAGNEVADYSVLVSSMRDDIKAGDGVVFKVYLLWLIVLFGMHLARLKVRYDLAVLRQERTGSAKRRGGKR